MSGINGFAGLVLAGSVCLSTATVGAQQPATSNPPAKADQQKKSDPSNKVDPTNKADEQSKDKANPDALILLDFKERIEKYLALRADAVKGAPPMQQTGDPKKIHVAEEVMALKIRTARASAKPGDVFTPQIEEKFRRLLAPETKGEDGRDAKAVLKDDAPNQGTKPAPTIPVPPPVKFKVNEKYPEGASLPTVPANLLLNLPTLPKELDYRIIDKHLILRDVEANMIIDYMLNVIK